MNIAIFTNNYLPNPYGVPGSIESFRKEFEALGPARNASATLQRSDAGGHQVYIFAPAWKGYEDKNPNVFRYPAIDINYKIKFPLAIPYSGKIDKILEKLDLDIIHSQHPNLLGSAAMKWAKRKKIPIVFTWHTLYDHYAHFVPVIPEKLSIWWSIRNARNYANQCAAVVTPTPFVAEIIRDWGVTNKNITAIPTGVEEAMFANPNRDSLRKKYNIKENEIVLLSVGRFTAEKNMEFLFAAAIEILKNNKDTKFLVGGEGYLKEKLEKIVAVAGVKDQVIFAGFMADEIKKDFYAAGDIFVFASKSETQGMILTEAMYAGLPFVAVRAPGAQDIILDGETGFLVPEDKKEFAGAVEKLINGKELRNKFSEEAKKVARGKYTSRICAEKMLEVYEKAIKLKKLSS